MSSNQNMQRTALYDFHLSLGAKMVPFAGYDMPVQYGLGVLKEHLHTREKAGLFDVSHMGQAYLSTLTDVSTGTLLEQLVPGNIAGLGQGRTRYTLLMSDEGGILDDLMVTNPVGGQDRLYLVVNAGCKEQDFAHISARLEGQAELDILDDRALLALQGPTAVDVLSTVNGAAAELGFMQAGVFDLMGAECFVTRSGYTGEDGFEISVPNEQAEEFARHLLDHGDVEAIGLGARDSLRLEAGLCLYGSDIDTTTSPVEAGLIWAISKPRRETGNFPGGARIVRELDEGPARLRVGIQPQGRAPARAHTEIVDHEGNRIGEITSGGFGPSAGGPVAMGYVAAEYAKSGTEVGLVVRGRILPAAVADMPFTPHRYYRKPA